MPQFLHLDGIIIIFVYFIRMSLQGLSGIVHGDLKNLKLHATLNKILLGLWWGIWGAFVRDHYLLLKAKEMSAYRRKNEFQMQQLTVTTDQLKLQELKKDSLNQKLCQLKKDMSFSKNHQKNPDSPLGIWGTTLEHPNLGPWMM